MIYMINSFSIILLKLSPYLVVGLIVAIAAYILVRHLRQLSIGQGSCCADNNPSDPQDTKNKHRSTGCSGCSLYTCPENNKNPPVNNDKLNNSTDKGGIKS